VTRACVLGADGDPLSGRLAVIDPTPLPASPRADAAERFLELWDAGRIPDVDEFLAGAGGLTVAEAAAVLRIDQRERWRRGERLSAEGYLARHPEIATDSENAIDVIFNEYLLREQSDGLPDAEEFLRRFPEHGDVLRAQIELHRAVASGPDGDSCGEDYEDQPQAEPGPQPEVPGYELLGEIGRGGMGVIYKARQRGLNRIVALKMISAGDLASAAERARLRNEAEAAARLQHPNIVQIYEVGSAAGMPYVALEYLAGGSLAAALKGKPLPPRAAAELVELLARTIQVAHEHGILHRDLKPANVLLTRRWETSKGEVAEGNQSTGDVGRTEQTGAAGTGGGPSSTLSAAPTFKITDFGLAKDLSGRGGHTATGAILGTPSYMAPEQAEGASKRVGPAADVYALGAILYETLTGRPPFQAATMLETLLQVRTQEVVSPSLLQHNLPRDLVTICMKALAKEPHRRYESAVALADDLRCFLHDRPIAARPVTRWERGWRWCRRNPFLAGVSAAAVALLVTAVAILAAGIVAVSRAQNRTQRALEAESIASKRARQALDEMFSQVVEDWLTSRAQLAPAQKAFLERALGHYEAFAAESGSGPDVRDAVGSALIRSGQIREFLGQQEDALRAYGKAQAVYEDLCRDYPAVADHRSRLAESYGASGDLLRKMGRLRDSEEAQHRGIAVLERQAADFPESPDRRGLARSQMLLGSLLRDAGRSGEGEEALRKALALQQGLVADLPDKPEYRLQLAATHNQLAILLANTRRPNDAERAFRDSLAIHRQLAIDFPGVPQYRYEVANGLYNLGTLFMTVDRKVAEAALHDALPVFRQLVADFPSVPLYRRYLANCHHNLAKTYMATGRAREAEAAYRDTVAVRRQLAADFPSTPLYREDAASDVNGLGIFLMEHDKAQEAESAFREGLALREELVRQYPEVTAYRGKLTDSRAALAVLWAGTGDHARAAGQVAEVEKNPDLIPGACYDLACACALASAAVAKDPKLAPSQRDTSADQYANKAVALLSRALTMGYKNFGGIKTDIDLNAIRGRPDFKELVRGLDAKKQAGGSPAVR
jgi:serine/threonine-protein kinase